MAKIEYQAPDGRPPKAVAVRLVEAPYRADRAYEYLVPEGMRGSVARGDFVIVPFGAGNRRMLGVVTALVCTPETEPEKLKTVLELRPPELRLTEEELSLCEFLYAHAFCTFGDALGAVVPAAVLRGLEKSAKPAGVKTDFIVSLSEHATSSEDDSRLAKSDAQRAVLSILRASGGSMTASELCSLAGITRAKLEPLIKRGVLTASEVEVLRDPYAAAVSICPPDDNILTPEQTEAAKKLSELAASGEPRAALLFGVTGSGKTRVIKAVIDSVVASGRQAIVLVPEIALTPQTVGFFRAFYGSRVAVLHSQLSAGERYDAWRRIRAGDVDVCVGTRSAVFAPFPNLGLIVIDEEQEHTYKSEMSPRYHARDVARFRCGKNNALLLLSSATPSVESFSRAQRGIYTLVELTQRYGDAVLPRGLIVDMREYTRRGQNSAFISDELREELALRLERGEQSILFVNRRGYHNYISCPKCGEAIMCHSCSVAMTYHAPERGNKNSRGRLICHYCGYERPAPEACPSCSFSPLYHVGYGTQRVEEKLRELFPQARILRMDSDTTKSKFAHDRLLAQFRDGEADILIGTQMVTKGHDFPNVTLVGVLDADGSLYMGDYRANERTFALITQVVGRAGRADKPGVALVQTFSPDHPIIRLAAKQDYKGMFRQEEALRRARGFPPFCDIVTLTLQSESEEMLGEAVKIMAERLRGLCSGEFADVKTSVFGPIEPQVYKLGGIYRLRFVIKCNISSRARALVRAALDALPPKLARNVSVIPDVNPNEI
ncbi:MAG TPA: primosomal protein N' [Bacillota bacterium]|nr:primosomal protein N' [Bacillota bacterium]